MNSSRTATWGHRSTADAGGCFLHDDRVPNSFEPARLLTGEDIFLSAKQSTQISNKRNSYERT